MTDDDKWFEFRMAVAIDGMPSPSTGETIVIDTIDSAFTYSKVSAPIVGRNRAERRRSKRQR